MFELLFLCVYHKLNFFHVNIHGELESQNVKSQLDHLYVHRREVRYDVH